MFDYFTVPINQIRNIIIYTRHSMLMYLISNNAFRNMTDKNCNNIIYIVN